MPEFDTVFGSRLSTKPRYQSFMMLASVKLLIAEQNPLVKGQDAHSKEPTTWWTPKERAVCAMELGASVEYKLPRWKAPV